MQRLSPLAVLTALSSDLGLNLEIVILSFFIRKYSFGICDLLYTG